MTLLQLRRDNPASFADEGRPAVVRAVQRVLDTLRMIHRAIIVAKTRRLERELMLHAEHRGRAIEPGDATRYPQRPLILDDKWDF
jgi:hypothetical protein